MKRLPTRRILVGACLAVAALAAPWWAGEARALTKINHVRVAPSDADAGTASPVVPSEAKSAWVLFDYTDANTRAKISIVVVNDGGDPLFTTLAPKYTGSGTGKIEITAADLVHGAADRVEALCEHIQSMAELGDNASATDGQILDTRLSIESDMRSLSRIMMPMDRAELTGDALAAKTSIDRLYPQVQAALEALDAIAITDVAAMRDRLRLLAPVAVDLADAGVALSGAVADSDDYTMGALRPDGLPYTVSIKVDEIGMGPATAGSTDLIITPLGKSDSISGVSGSSPATSTPRMPSEYQSNEPGSAARQNTATPASARTITNPQGGTDGKSAAGTPNVEDPKAALRLAAGSGTGIPPAAATLRAAATTDSAGNGGSADAESSSGAGASVADGQGTPSAAQSGVADAPSSGDGNASVGSPGSNPLPTFTVPAGGGTGADPAPRPGGRGPNLLVLAGGVVALIGLALWFRRRL